MRNPFRTRLAALPGLNVGLLEKTLIRQQGQSDCGVACLASLLAFYGGHSRLERLRDLSGTDAQGTTLLGLCQAARQVGFEADGMQADAVENLKTDVAVPVVLHVLIDRVLQHYVVCYGWDTARQQFLIGDPARGLTYLTTNELAAIWPSLVLLHPVPTDRLVKQTDETKQQRTWLLNLVRADVPLLAIATGLGIVTAGLGLSTAIFSQKLVDEILPKHDTKRLLLGVALLALLLVARAVVGFLRGLLLNRQSRDFNNRIVNQFYGSLLRLPKSFFDGRKTGELIARLNDTGRIQRTISHLTGAVVINALVVLISAGYIFTYAVPVGLLTLLSIPLFAGLVWRYHGRIMAGQREAMAASARTESNYVDTIQGIDVIKTAGRESFFSAITKTVYGRYQDQAYALNGLSLRFNLTADVIAALLITAILGLISWLVVQKTLQLGEMMAVLTLVGTIIPAVVALSLTNIQLQEARVAFDRMYEYGHLTPEPTENVPDPNFQFESLSVQGLDFRFPGRALLLESASLMVRRGEWVTLLGESGSGKSTLLQMLQRFYPPENGELLVNGHDWQQIDTSTWRKALGVVPQQIKLFSGTLLDNICLSHTADEAEAIVGFCREYGFAPYFEQFPQSYLTILGEDGVNLSGGQRQLVALARALYQRPQLLLLDEPTAAMDGHTEQFVLDLLRQLQPQVAILFITHKQQHTELANRTYQVENRRLVPVVETGTPARRHSRLAPAKAIRREKCFACYPDASIASLHNRPKFPNNTQQFGVEGATGHNVAAEKGGVAALEIGDGATGFAHQTDARRHIPGFEVVLEKGFEPPRRHVGQINGGRPHAAQAVGTLHQLFQNVEVRLHLLEPVVGKPRGNQPVGQGCCARYPDGPLWPAAHAEPRPLPQLGRETLVAVGVENNARYGVVALRQTDAHGING